MANRKQGFTFSQHKEIAAKLHSARSAVQAIHTEIVNSYPNNSPVLRCSNSALSRIDALRNELDNLVCAENPNMTDHDVVNVYYGLGDNKLAFNNSEAHNALHNQIHRRRQQTLEDRKGRYTEDRRKLQDRSEG